MKYKMHYRDNYVYGKEIAMDSWNKISNMCKYNVCKKEGEYYQQLEHFCDFLIFQIIRKRLIALKKAQNAVPEAIKELNDYLKQ